jgi:hypothetical protein
VILDSFGDLHWAAVTTTVVMTIVIGAIWFSPPVFGRFWAGQVSGYSGVPADDVAAAAARPSALAKWLVALAAADVTLAMTAAATGVDSPGDGAGLGALLGIGLGGAFFSWPSIFAGMPWRWWFVNSAALVVMLTLSGVVLGTWT